MTKKQLKQLIKQGENQAIEFKNSLNLKNEIGQTVSALANSKGGVILIGISDQGKVLGITIGKKTMEDLAKLTKYYVPINPFLSK